jgi:hypothetical protein
LVLTDTIMVEPGRLALTTTPSIFPSSLEETVPVSAAGPWFCASAGWLPPTSRASKLALVITRVLVLKDKLARTLPSRVVVIEPSRGGAAVHFSRRRILRRVRPIKSWKVRWAKRALRTLQHAEPVGALPARRLISREQNYASASRWLAQ